MKGVVPYNKNCGIMIEKINEPLSLEMLGHGGQVTLKQATKEGVWEKSKLCIGLGYETIIDHFESNNMCKKEVLWYKNFMEDLVLYVAKG